MLIRDTSVGTATFTVALGALALAMQRFGSMSIGMVDAWSDMNSRVGLAIGNMEGSAAVMDRLSDVAMRTYSSLEMSAESFVRNSTVLRELGKATSEQLDFTEALNLALVVSGAKAERAAQLQTALGRAMAAGSLRGQELNTIIESGGRVAEVLAEELGVGTNALRALGAQGRITSDVMYNSLVKRLEQLREQAELMPATIGDGLLLLRNSFLRLIGVFDQTNKLSETVAGGLVGIAQSLGTIASAAAVAGTALATMLAGRVLSSLGGAVASAIAFQRAIGSASMASAAFSAVMMGTWNLLRAHPFGIIATSLTTAAAYIVQFGEETYKIGQTTLHVGNIMKAVWATLSESIKMVISAVSGLALSVWNFVTLNWSDAVAAAEGAAQNIAASASRVAEAWSQITTIPGTDRFAFAGNMAQHMPKIPSPKMEAWEPSDFEQAIGRIRQRTEALQAESNVVGMATYEAEKYLATQELISVAKKSGMSDIAGLLPEIEKEAAAYARVAAAMEHAREAQQRLDDVRGTFQSSFSSFAQYIARGSSALDSLASSLQRVADKLIDMAMNDLFENAFGKAGTGNSFFGALANGGGSGGLLGGALISGILHNGGIAGNDNTPSRAVSMAAFANAPRYHTGGIAGLRPNEVPAVLERGEEVLTRRDPRHRDNGGGGAAPVVNVNIDASGADVAAIARLDATVANLKRDLPAIVTQSIRKSNQSNVKFG